MDKRKRRRIVGRAITFGVLGLAAALIAVGFVPKPVPATSGKVVRRALAVTVDESGKTRIRDKYVVSSPVTGQLSRIALREGDPVKEGDVLALITPLAPQLLDARTRAEAAARVDVADANLKRAQATIKRAQSALAYAQTQAERSRMLQRQGGVSQQQFEETEYQLRSAQEEFASSQLAERVADGELSAARAALTSMSDGRRAGSGELSVTAPTAGRVLRVVQESEGAVQAGTPLLEIGDPQKLEIAVDVLTTDAVGIAVGAQARIERWGGAYPLSARVQRKQPSAYTTRSALGVEEQRVPVILDLVEDPARWTALGDGYRVEAQIQVTRVENALVVPASALFREAGAWTVFAVRDARAKKQRVELGIRNADWAEVKSGLAEGESVILYPSDQVADGVRVQARVEPM